MLEGSDLEKLRNEVDQLRELVLHATDPLADLRHFRQAIDLFSRVQRTAVRLVPIVGLVEALKQTD